MSDCENFEVRDPFLRQYSDTSTKSLGIIHRHSNSLGKVGIIPFLINTCPTFIQHLLFRKIAKIQTKKLKRFQLLKNAIIFLNFILQSRPKMK